MHSNKLLIFVLLLAVCLMQFASDIYAPSLPAIAASFASSVYLAQISMAIYMLGVALSQLIYGPLSEGIGRRQPIIIGLCIMLIGSITCMSATNIHYLILGRLIQGCGAGATAALWRSIFRDIFTGEQLAKVGSYLTVFVMFIVPLAPAVGGYLQHYFGWRSVFVFISIYIALALIAILIGFRETSQHHHSERLKFSYITTTFRQLLISRVFMGTTLLLGYLFFGINSWDIVIPFILFYFGSTFIWPNAFATAFTPFGKIAGYAGALYGFMQIAGGAVIGGIVAHLPADTQVPLALVILIASLLAWMIYERTI